MVRRSIVVCLAVLSVAALAWCDRKADLDNNGGDQTPAVQTRTVAPGSEAVRAASPACTAKLWSSNGAAWDWLDDFDGPNAVLAVGATNAALPGPGADAVFGTGQVEIIDHVARLKGSGPGPCPCALSPTGPSAELPAHTPGKAIVAYLAVPDAAATNRGMQHVIGWTSREFAYKYSFPQVGLEMGNGKSSRDLAVFQCQSKGKVDFERSVFQNVLRSGDCLGVAVELTATGYTVYIQGSIAEQWGCILGSNNWFPVLSSACKVCGKPKGMVASRWGVPLYVSRFGQMTQFRNDGDAHAADCRITSRRTLHDTSLCPDQAGGLWVGWHASTQELGPDLELLVARRAPNGSWSPKQVVVPEKGASDYRHNGSISMVNGQVWYVYSRSTDKFKTTTVHYVVLSADAANNVTWDAEHTLAVPSSNAIISSHAYTLPGGRILLPAFGEVSEDSWVLYSDDRGATWKESAHIRGCGELTLAREPSGQLVAFARPNAPNYVLRLTSADGGATWSEPRPTAVWNPSCKFQARDLPDGNVLLVGNEFPGQFNYCLRPKVTAYILGNRARVLRKIPLADYGPTQYNAARLNYPDAVLIGKRLYVSWAHQGEVSNVWVVGANVDDWIRNTLNKETAERRLRAVLTKDNTLFSHPSVLPPKEKTPAGTIQSGPDGHLYWHNGADWKRLDN